MAEDYRVEVGFWDHPKTVRLMRRLGPEAAISVQRLWEFCASNPSRSTGDLEGMDDEAIEIAVKWTGQPGAWIDAVTTDAMRFVDGDENERMAHELEVHQPWLAGAAERSESGRIASLVRWHSNGKHAVKRRGCPLCFPQSGPHSAPHTGRIKNGAGRTKNDAGRIAGSIDPQCPDSDSDSDPQPSTTHSPRRVKAIKLNDDDRPPWKSGDPIVTMRDWLDATQHLRGGSAPYTPSAKTTALIEGGQIEWHEYGGAIAEADVEGKGPNWVAGKIYGRREDAAKLAALPATPASSRDQMDTAARSAREARFSGAGDENDG